MHGYVDHCPHAGWPLAARPDRYLTREADRLFCSAHGALFRIEDGLCDFGPCFGEALEEWAVRIDGDGMILTADANRNRHPPAMTSARDGRLIGRRWRGTIRFPPTPFRSTAC